MWSIISRYNTLLVRRTMPTSAQRKMLLISRKTILKIVDSSYESMRYIKISSNIKIFILIMRFVVVGMKEYNRNDVYVF